MKSVSVNRGVDIEGNVAEPIEKLRLKLIYKIVFFAFGILATLIIIILIQLSDNLVLEKKRQALRHFEEIASHVIEHQNHSV
ncbi:uncharacterized protein LOC105218920 [Zeugodacus cucurbitae]|uniref:uncharacterized protein LOC105218920 n=1 Tax=Zeugodacus cucurbitae TaxID=28588 RepID=UPI000596905E|nr:uncharacterized protein LOC105218920 [Zeugodacus cucurbitae]